VEVLHEAWLVEIPLAGDADARGSREGYLMTELESLCARKGLSLSELMDKVHNAESNETTFTDAELCILATALEIAGEL
jgi:hypothetical protein